LPDRPLLCADQVEDAPPVRLGQHVECHRHGLILLLGYITVKAPTRQRFRPTIAINPAGNCSSPKDGLTSASTPCSASNAGVLAVSMSVFSWRSSSRRHVPSSLRTKVVISRTNLLGAGIEYSVAITHFSVRRTDAAVRFQASVHRMSERSMANTPPGRSASAAATSAR